MSSGGPIEDVVFDISNALRIPVLLVALIALAVVIVELGRLIIELKSRRPRDPVALRSATERAREALVGGDRHAAARWLRPAVASGAMAVTIAGVLADTGTPDAAVRVPKNIADFDLGSIRRLERTRMLVRAGPALGLMGTLILLSPALDGLADGDLEQLTDKLRIAFSVTVLGLLVGALAFGISLVRDRLYAQDRSDLQFIAATLETAAVG